jgi:ubiquinone biosynthesis UbiH/UbiF/VisC/COQ6 family hydroxylase
MYMHHDIVIIGAGPAGLSLARALANTKLNILLVEKSSVESLRDPAPDGREIALTHLSVDILKALGAWQRIKPEAVTPINGAKVLNGNSAYSLDFDNRRHPGEALGYMVSNYLIRRALYEEVQTLSNVEWLTGCTVDDLVIDSHTATVVLSNGEQRTASLVVAADSRFSSSRRRVGIPARMRDFSRVAIVCRARSEKPHNNIAYECFQYERTLAVLPLAGNLCSIVITVPTALGHEIVAMDEDRFNVDIQKRFGNRLGAMELVGERHLYPLVAVHADRFVAQRIALVGDAAVGMHPVTAHGFNLGLRGASTLAEEIGAALQQGRDFASASVLQNYQSRHMRITRPMYVGTNGIVGLFTNDAPPAKALRNLVLRIANNLPPVKRFITDRLTEKASVRLPFVR